MTQSAETSVRAETELLLDRCIDRLLGGDEWADVVESGPQPARAELTHLMAVASQVLTFARGVRPPDADARRQVWQRFKNKRSLLRTIAFYRLPYLPPLWLKPEAS